MALLPFLDDDDSGSHPFSAAPPAAAAIAARGGLSQLELDMLCVSVDPAAQAAARADGSEDTSPVGTSLLRARRRRRFGSPPCVGDEAGAGKAPAGAQDDDDLAALFGEVLPLAPPTPAGSGAAGACFAAAGVSSEEGPASASGGSAH
eukprot:TRINITY_DN46970_c0_g1_i1.p2 TRINITY_DN46970_c0_g1~~TRINITY_DN46970_c0_g1_i1.p2  ORF type:complete len:148 (-),score=48.27 TRINITY_DN46970_c0_g1_i1:58-501(-)